MKRTFALFALASLLSLSAAAADTKLKSGVFEPPRAAPEFVLPSSTGADFKLSSTRGKVVVLEFGYTNCADVCPVSLASLAQARKAMGSTAADVQVVFVTVDPVRDTPAKLKGYLSNFDPSFIGVSGTPEQVAAVLKAYGISVTKKMAEGSKTDYSMHHSSYLYFVDRKGMQRALMPFGRPPAEMVHDLTLLLKQ